MNQLDILGIERVFRLNENWWIQWGKKLGFVHYSFLDDQPFAETPYNYGKCFNRLQSNGWIRLGLFLRILRFRFLLERQVEELPVPSAGDVSAPVTQSMQKHLRSLDVNRTFEQPLITICVTTQNQLDYIMVGLDSLLIKTCRYPRLVEVIVCDDASTDGKTLQYLAKCTLWPSVSLHRHKQPLGQLKSLDEMVKEARGEFVWMLRDADVVLPGMLEKVLQIILDFPQIQMIYGNYSTSNVNVSPSGVALPNLIKRGVPATAERPDHYVRRIADAATYHEGLFSGLSYTILRRGHAVNAYRYEGECASVSPKKRVPWVEYVAEHLLDQPGYWIGHPLVLMLGKTNGETEAKEWAREKVLPEIQELLRKPESEFPNTDFAQRHPSASTLMTSSTPPPPRIGLVSSWNVKCGLATYSGNLFKGFPLEYQIYANYIHPDELICKDETNVYRCWKATSNDALSFLEDVENDVWVFQHHGHYFSIQQSVPYFQMIARRGEKIFIIPHNLLEFQDVITPAVANALGEIEGLKILIHTEEGLQAFAKKIPKLASKIIHFPHGVVVPPDIDKHLCPNRPEFVIGSFGFLLPHKGILELIEAFKLVVEKEPKARLRLYNSIHSECSQAYEKECRDLIIRHRLESCVYLCTDFIPETDVIRLLGECDLLALPYKSTTESASGAARLCLSSGTPLIVSANPIFQDLHSVVDVFRGTSQQDLAEDLISRIRNPALLRDKRAAILKWLEKHDWKKVSARLQDMILESRREASCVVANDLPQSLSV